MCILNLYFSPQEIEPCQGSVVAYVPSLIVDDKKQRGEGGGGGDMSMEGYLIFASGPNLNELSIHHNTLHALHYYSWDKVCTIVLE